ncbi:Pimeloyl-ACP methyl ester carboxylesterase [Shimia gijangensis]|uniref:Pimeloyl-ACP methyl ester carboxylesterase n=1 Tax=Shimia gijangensis TaxID=1470563 RepID=A0A1M6HY45_9RHOB|nr:alpha/beta hydrolase [Shimia gijangensis]SHJ27047.1 Pimeloyl-ACP methyl ester carboxylesterase [Shimia gijangensis]
MMPIQSQTQLGPHIATALQFGGAGTPLHFYHANGFGASAYLPYLQRIAPHYCLSALNMRPLWPNAPAPERKIGWHQYADDLIAWLEATQSGPVVGLGHSMGAVATAFAANKRPDLFQALVLIEPPGTSLAVSALLRSVPYNLRKRLGPIRAASRARHIWPDCETMFGDLRPDPAYKRFDDAGLRHLIANTTHNNTKGVSLSFPVNWEMHNYLHAPHSLPALSRLQVPTHIIAAKTSFFCPPEVMAKIEAKRPDVRFSNFPNHGHLMPLEAPEDAATATLDALGTLL